MKHTAPKGQRCGIYTRKSTEHNLDLAFNSLDAQREACEAYVKSQAHEGWTLLRDRFDDGGLSGASLDRPALQSLMDLVRARQIDVVVVYKVDRLTRSLADFAKLVELFDECSVSFVSVTQSFNTTSSMGRLTLNVLLSFAQFEREVIGERVRDKIAASKRKGIWVGGPVPLGYRSVDKKLEIVPEDAAVVRRIFTAYLRVGSIVELAALLQREGVRPKAKRAAPPDAPVPRFGVGALFYLLKNRIYVGDIVYRGEAYRGEHEGILDREIFEAVQQRLQEQAAARSNSRRSSPSLLCGKIFDDRGNPMTPMHANKKGVRYRYYVSQALLQGRKQEAGAAPRVSAPDVERLVVNALRENHSDNQSIQCSDRELLEHSLARAIIGRGEIKIAFSPIASAGNDSAGAGEPPAASAIVIPFTPGGAVRKGAIHIPGSAPGMDEVSRTALLRAVARARGWIDAMAKDPTLDFSTIATREGLGARYVRRLASFAYLSPKIVDAIADSRAPTNLTATRLLSDLPLSWAEQERLFLSA
ncbi:recombinase family protein [Methylocystis rosea]|uniref:recombinase family protein n=1 Tax=Methylocystis rosea TaxID=173366 RepID=UPI0003658A22|nr:recombinase family protein [Methylocystis rosea]